MNGFKKSIELISFKHSLLYVLVFNTGIAWLLTLAVPERFWDSFILSHSFGITICCFFYLFDRFRTVTLYNLWIPLLAGIAVGFGTGVLLLVWKKGYPIAQLYEAIRNSPGQGVVVNLAWALFFSIIISYFLFSKAVINESRRALQEEKIKRLDNEKQIVETQLRLLQAQIEPHFLFNTLSNIASLIDRDPLQGKAMLNSLTLYLRQSLRNSRDEKTTLGKELEFIGHYLDILKIRMGARLNYSIEASAALQQLLIPPMLLQPLVENAIQHGLEPAKQGGDLVIGSELRASRLRLFVSDTGVGLVSEGQSGFGLYNIRQRLRSLYGDTAILQISARPEGGVLAEIELPDPRHKDDGEIHGVD